MLSIFTLRLAANEAREAAVTGEYFEIRNALFPIALVELLDKSGGIISRLENPEQSDFVKPGLFETVRITNGPTAQAVRYFFGSGDAGSRRTSGLVRIDGTSSVSVVDGGISRTLQGMTYVGAIGSGVPAAGLFGSVALFNPAASGFHCIVKKIFLTSQAGSQSANVSSTNSSAGLDIGPYPSKNLGLALPSKARLVTNNNAPAIVGSGVFLQLNCTQPGRDTYTFDEPIVVTPGIGLVMNGNVSGVVVAGGFEWFEQAI